MLCCYNCTAQGCLQPICQKERTEAPTWFNGGPPILCLPLPIPDSSRPWGSQCSECKGSCYGHFLQPAEALQSTLQPMFEPPQKVAEDPQRQVHNTQNLESELYYSGITREQYVEYTDIFICEECF